MGVVYRAWNTQRRELVALKVLAPNMARNGMLMARFMREAERGTRLIHPNIVRVYLAAPHQDTFYIEMEHVDGPNLRTVLDRRGRIDAVEAATCIRDSLLGLGYAHTQGCVHRDVKPDNLLRSSGGEIKISDFGLARDVGTNLPRLTQVGQALGTPPFMPPEQWNNADVDGRADIFATGVTLYLLLTGHVPFPGNTSGEILGRIFEGRPEPLSAYLQEVDPALQSFIDTCLQRDANNRWQNANDAADYLSEWLEARRHGGPAPGVTQFRREDRATEVRDPMDGPTIFDLPKVEKVRRDVKASAGLPSLNAPSLPAGGAPEPASSPSPVPSAFTPGMQLDEYQLSERVWGDEHWAIWTGRDQGLGRPVRVLEPLARSSIAQLQEDPLGEGKRAVEFAHHRLLAGLCRVARRHEPPFMVVNTPPAPTVDDYVLKGGPVRESQAVALLIQLADVLEYASQQGVLHGNLIPGAIGVVQGLPPHRPFVLAGMAPPSCPGIGSIIARATYPNPQAITGRNTEVWAAPESFTSEYGISVAGDLFSLGMLAVLLLTAAPPSHHLDRQLDAAGATPRFREIIGKLAEVDPFQRPPTPGAALTLLRGLSSDA